MSAPFRCDVCGAPTPKAYVDAARADLVGYCAQHAPPGAP